MDTSRRDAGIKVQENNVRPVTMVYVTPNTLADTRERRERQLPPQSLARPTVAATA
jgi:hypothetical protein